MKITFKNTFSFLSFILFLGIGLSLFQNCSKGVVNFGAIDANSLDPQFVSDLQIIKHPLNREAYTTSSVTIDVVVKTNKNVTDVSYQWMKGAASIPGATDSSYTINDLEEVHTGEYSVEVTANSLLDSKVMVSSAANLLVLDRGNRTNIPPDISNEPSSSLVLPNDSLVLHVVNKGLPRPSVAWFKGGSTAPLNMNKDYLLIENMQTSDYDYYRAEVQNSMGTLETKIILVTDKMTTPVLLSGDTLPTSIAAGTNLDFTVEGYGYPSPSFQWSRKINNTFTPISTNGIYEITDGHIKINGIESTGAMEEFKLDVVNSAGTVSKIYAISVNNTIQINSYSGSGYPNNFPTPSVKRVKVGGSVNYNVNASLTQGNQALAYKWQFKKKGTGAFVDLASDNNNSGIDSNNLIVNNIDTNDSGDYRLNISVNGDTLPSAVVELAVVVPPSIDRNNDLASSIKKTGGDQLDLSVPFNSNATAPITCVLKRNNSQINTNTANGSLCSFVLSNVNNGDEGNYIIDVSGPIADTTDSSSVADVDVIIPPKILTDPASQIVDAGNNATLSVVLDSTSEGPFDYVWYRNNAPTGITSCMGIFAKSCSIQISNLDESLHDGNYKVIVTENVLNNTDTSNNAALNFNPVVTTQPDDAGYGGAVRSLNEGDNETLTFVLSNPRVRNYSIQWFHGGVALSNGGAIAGSKSNTLVISGVAPANAGQYYAEITDDDNALLKTKTGSVDISIAGIPLATIAEGGAITIDAGTTLTLNGSSSTNSPTPSYSWTKNDGTLIGTTPQLSLANINYMEYNGETIKFVVKVGSLFSPAASISVTVNPKALSISVPNSVSANEGFDATFTASNPQGGSEVLANYSYQWQEDIQDGNGFVNINGATNLTYIKPSVSSVDAAKDFRFCMTDNVTAQNSCSGTINLIVNAANPISIDNPQLVDISVAEGSSAIFRIYASQGNSALTYVWKRDGVVLPGETSSIYTLSSPTIAADNGAVFSVTVADNINSTSRSSTLTVTPAVVGVSISSPPMAITVVEDEPAVFTVGTSGGAGTITYQWKKNGVSIGGANGSSYTIANSKIGTHEGNYSVSVADNNTTLPDTAAVALTINPRNLSVTVSVSDSNVDLNVGENSVTFTANPVDPDSGSRSYSYVWYEVDLSLNQTLIAGATSSAYTLSGISDESKSGFQYQVVVTDLNSPGTPSANAAGLLTITAVAGNPLAITQAPVDVTVFEGKTATFSVTAIDGAGTKKYQWKKDGVDMPGETNSSLSLPGVIKGVEDQFTYSVVVSDDITTLPVTTEKDLKIDLYSLSVTVDDELVDLNVTNPGSVTFTAFNISGGSGNYNYQWEVDDRDDSNGTVGYQVIPGANSTTYTISNITDTNLHDYDYRMVLTDAESPNTPSDDEKGRLKITALLPCPILTAGGKKYEKGADEYLDFSSSTRFTLAYKFNSANKTEGCDVVSIVGNTMSIMCDNSYATTYTISNSCKTMQNNTSTLIYDYK